MATCNIQITGSCDNLKAILCCQLHINDIKLTFNSFNIETDFIVHIFTREYFDL